MQDRIYEHKFQINISTFQKQINVEQNISLVAVKPIDVIVIAVSNNIYYINNTTTNNLFYFYRLLITRENIHSYTSMI